MEHAAAARLNLRTADLVIEAANGDQASWDALVDRFSSMVWSVARRRLNAADAADVCQTTWMQLVRHLDRIEQPERVGAWLATTARRESLRVQRRAGRQIPTLDDDVTHHLDNDVCSRRTAPRTAVDGDLLVAERDVEVREVFKQLPPRCQKILRLLMADSPPSYRDLSNLLDIPVGSIGPTRARCLEHLRRLAESAGLTLADDER